VSVTALSSAVLERSNVRELGDLVKLAPGLRDRYGLAAGQLQHQHCEASAPSRMALRWSPDVAVVVDDVPIGFQAEAFKDLIDDGAR